MSINVSTHTSSTCLPTSQKSPRAPTSSPSANTDRTTATLATHKSLFPTMLPSLIPTNNSRQTNTSDTPPPSRRQSLAKSTTASLAKMVPSLSKKMIDRGDIAIPHRQRTQSFSTSTSSSQHQATLVRRWSLKMHDTSTQPSPPYTHGSNKHGSVLNSTISSAPAPNQTRHHSRDPLAQRRSSLASITHQNKTETLHPTPLSQMKYLASSSHSSDSGLDQSSRSPMDAKHSKQHPQYHHRHHHHHHLHRRTSIAAPVSDPNNPSSLVRRRSLADVSSRSTQQQQQQQQPSRLRHPSWLDSAGFMQPSKCAACHPPPPKRTTVLTPPDSVGVPSFGLPAGVSKSRRSSVICEKSDPLFGLYSARRSSVDTLSPPRKLPWEKPCLSDAPSPPPSGPATPSSTPSDTSLPPLQQDLPEETNKESGISSSSLMSDDTATQFTMPSSSSSASSVSDNDVLSAANPDLPPKSDFEQWTTKLRLTLGRWFTDLNHGQLEHCETDEDGAVTLTISGVVVNMAPWTTTHRPYLLRLDPHDPSFAFTDAWASDDAVNTCQFNTDSTQCGCTFDWMNRRHHCRKCGNIFCKEHSSNRLPLFSKDRQTQLRWSRVCDTCCFQLVGAHLASV